MGDSRLTALMVGNAPLLDDYPGPFTGADSGGDAAADGFHRLIEHPPMWEETAESILTPHRERLVQRMQGQRTVLAIQEGTSFDFAKHRHSHQVGLVGGNRTGETVPGLYLHATLAVTGAGLPLGVSHLGFAQLDKKGKPKIPEIKLWLDGFAGTVRTAARLANKTRVVAVCDCEADAFELFDAQRRSQEVELLAGAGHDRDLDDGRKLFATMADGADAGMIEVEVEGLAERGKSGEEPARPAMTKRVAQCELRLCKVALSAAAEGGEPVSLSAVQVVETAPPPGEKPVQRRLLTTLPVETGETAAEAAGYYLQRRRAEDWLRVLKSGCESYFLDERNDYWMRRTIATNAVIAWRVMLMILLGRQAPEREADLLFSDEELGFLQSYAKHEDLKPPASLGQSVRLVARLGGHRERESDSEPGCQTMWRGYDVLIPATLGHRIGFESGRREANEKGRPRGFEAGKKHVLEMLKKHVE